MFDTPIPYWMLTKKTYAGGMRQAKRKKWTMQSEWSRVQNGGSFYQARPLPPSAYVPGNSLEPARDGKNLLNSGEYRYWGSGSGFGSQSTFGFCRCCLDSYRTRKERTEHKQKGCGRILEKAWHELKREHTCVICQGTTTQTRWGVRLCSKECREMFMRGSVRPARLVAIMNKIKDTIEKEKNEYIAKQHAHNYSTKPLGGS
jgi:hypothetical protein